MLSLNREFSFERVPTLPALAFAAEIIVGNPRISVICGGAVETDGNGLIAGAWAGGFEQRAIEEAASSIGTALRRTSSGLIAVVGTATTSMLYVSRIGPRLIVANSLALALAVADDQLVTSYAFYPQDLATLLLGSDRYKHTLRTQRGTVSAYYGSMKIGGDGTLRAAEITAPPPFPDFEAYRSYLVGETRAILANAGDPARRQAYQPIVALSAGYDSPAAATIAREVGCRAAFTFRQPIDRPDADEDSGAAIGESLGFETRQYDTFAFRRDQNLPEVEFIASSFGGGQLYLAATGDDLSNRVVVSGYAGDEVWATGYGLDNRPHFPIYTGGYSQNEFFARAPALDLSVPMIGARNFVDIGKISRSERLRPWSIGGSYDRPIARRLVEEAGIDRDAFASRKRSVTPTYDTLTRREIDLNGFLSPASLAAFEQWFAKTQPINRLGARGHRLLTETAGRVIWSGKLRRALARHGISWPPFPAHLQNLKIPVRRNAFVFNWAVSIQVDRYRRLLGKPAHLQMPG